MRRSIQTGLRMGARGGVATATAGDTVGGKASGKASAFSSASLVSAAMAAGGARMSLFFTQQTGHSQSPDSLASLCRSSRGASNPPMAPLACNSHRSVSSHRLTESRTHVLLEISSQGHQRLLQLPGRTP
jgi:hypothetical protein